MEKSKISQSFKKVEITLQLSLLYNDLEKAGLTTWRLSEIFERYDQYFLINHSPNVFDPCAIICKQVSVRLDLKKHKYRLGRPFRIFS